MLYSKKTFLGAALTLSASSLLPSCVHADPFLPVPPASFLNYHVSTARGLSEQVAGDVVVRARLARHFGMPAAAVSAYVRQNLVETTLSARQAGRYRVACIGPSGREYSVWERLPAGTPVFALATTGKPILRLACGNPLVAALPPVAPKPHARPKPAHLALSSKTLPQVSVPASQVPDEPIAVETPALSPSVESVAPDSPHVQVAGATQSLNAPHLGGKGLGFLPVLIGAVGVGVVSGHHGSSPTATAVPPIKPTAPVTPTAPVIPVAPIAPVTPVTPITPVVPVTPTTPVAPITPTAPPAAVPEPNSLLLIGLFGGVLAGRQWKAMRR